MRIDVLFIQAPTIACAVIGLSVLGRLDTSLRYLAVHALLSAFTEIVSQLMAPNNNHAVLIVFLPVDFLLIILAFRDYFRKGFLPAAVTGAALFLGVYSYIITTHGHEFLPFEAVVASWMIQSVFCFVVLLRNTKREFGPDTLPIYLVAGGIMLYTSTSIPVWAMFRYNMEHHPGIAGTLQGLANVMGMIRYLATAIALILLANRQVPAVHAV